MGLLSILMWVACSPKGEVLADTSSPECTEWPVDVGDVPVFGGNAAGTIATGGPAEWPVDVVRALEVSEGFVQLTNLDGRAVYGDFVVDAGLSLERVWSPDGWLDIMYDAPLQLWPMPISDEWESTASFSNAVVADVVNAGVDTWSAAVTDVVDLYLDGIVFEDVAVVEARLERELALSTGDTQWTETAWFSSCHGIIARNRDGEAMRLIP